MTAKPIKEIIEKILSRNSMQDVKVLVDIEKRWKEIAGEQIHKNTEIEKVHKKLLKIRVFSGF